MKLEHCDILIYINDRDSLISKLSRWAIGRYDHVSMYLGRSFSNIPFLYESDGRGVCLGNIQKHTGRPVRVLRPISNEITKDMLISQAITIASDDCSYYDYLAIVKSCLPRVLKTKFPWLPLPFGIDKQQLTAKRQYRTIASRPYIRDSAFICSEAVAEVFWRTGVDIVPQDIVPLPGDFENSPHVHAMEEGILMLDIIP